MRPDWNRWVRRGRWALLGSLAYLGLNVLEVVLGSYRDRTGMADCAIILGAAVWPGERPSLTLRARTWRGGEVYRAGYTRHLILTGSVGKHPPAEAEVMRRLLATWGVPAEAMVLEDQATTTAESARLCAEIMRRRGWESALIVSDPWHTPRATRLFRREGMRALPCPAFDSPTWTRLGKRLYYTLREAAILACRRIIS
jgi:uncharacterized SAM-binding protein YcdF (DUF218 family)